MARSKGRKNPEPDRFQSLFQGLFNRLSRLTTLLLLVGIGVVVVLIVIHLVRARGQQQQEAQARRYAQILQHLDEARAAGKPGERATRLRPALDELTQFIREAGDGPLASVARFRIGRELLDAAQETPDATQRTGLLRQAEESFREFSARSAASALDVSARELLGATLEEQERPEEALRVYEQAQREYPESTLHPKLEYDAVRCLIALGQKEEALHRLDLLVREQLSDNRSAWSGMVRHLQRLLAWEKQRAGLAEATPLPTVPGGAPRPPGVTGAPDGSPEPPRAASFAPPDSAAPTRAASGHPTSSLRPQASSLP